MTTPANQTLLNSPTLPMPTNRLGRVGLTLLLSIALSCLFTLPWSLHRYDLQRLQDTQDFSLQPPKWSEPMGTDLLGRSMLWRCLLGGAISLGIGAAAAAISVAIGVSWGATAGYLGGKTDAFMMRTVDVLYGLPYILLVVLANIALKPSMEKTLNLFLPTEPARAFADVATLLIAIGGVSWLTMARVIRGQVLSLRTQPFIEAAHAYGVGPTRIIFHHLLPNLLGPIIVYSTLTIPSAILQESFLSFLGIGVQLPIPSWGNLAAAGLGELHMLGAGFGPIRWWLIFWPCTLLAATLLALNFLGDSLTKSLNRGVSA